MPTYQDSQGKYFKTQAEAAASNTKLGTNPRTANINVGVIPVDGLTKNVSPLTVPPPITPNYGGLETNINSVITTSKAQQEADRIEREKNLETKGEDITDKFNELLGVNEDLGDVSSEVDFSDKDKARKEADEFTSQMEAEQLNNRRTIEALRKNNPQGLFGGALEQEVERINRESLSKQADIAILQSAANRRYDTAAEIADRQVAMKTEQLKAKAENLKAFIEFNKADFDKEETRLYNEAQKKLDAEVKKEETLQNDIKAVKLEAVKNGAPLSVLTALGKAKTLDEALQSVGSYLSTPNTSVVKLDNGTTLLIDTKTGKTIRNFGGGGGGGVDLPANTPEALKGLVSIGSLVGGFSSVNAQKMFLKNLSDLAARGDEKGLAEKIIGQALANIPDADTRKRVSSGFTISKELTRLGGLLDQYEAQGGETGLLRGKKQDVLQRLGKVGDPELASIGTQILNTLDLLVRARTGAALTESEEAFYKKILPSTGNVGDLNEALISGLKTSLMADVENNLINNITTEGFNMVRGTLPEVFDGSDPFLGNFTPQNINRSLNNASFFKQF